MKKILEAELMSMAHSILKMKDRSNVHELKMQAEQLFQKLSLLSFAEKHFEGNQPSIGRKEFIEAFYNEFDDLKPAVEKASNKKMIPEDVNSESLEGETLIETSKAASEKIEAKKESESLLEDYEEDIENQINPDLQTEDTPTTVKNEEPQVHNLKEEDFGVHFDDLPLFETKIDEPKVSEVDKEEAKLPYPKSEATENNEAEVEESPTKPTTTADLFSQDKKSLNDQLKKGIKIGLNDRLAFTRQLFDGNVEDYNRVLSQLNTMHSFEDAKSFIENAVKPEYQNWEGKENFETRFLSIVETRFEE